VLKHNSRMTYHRQCFRVKLCAFLVEDAVRGSLQQVGRERPKPLPLNMQQVRGRQVVYCVVLCVRSSSLYLSLSRVPVFPFTLLYHTDAISILSLRKEVHPSARTPECHLKSTIESLSQNRRVSVKSTTLYPGGLHRRRRRTDATQISR
jgi:hypothetical protein